MPTSKNMMLVSCIRFCTVAEAKRVTTAAAFAEHMMQRSHIHMGRFRSHAFPSILELVIVDAQFDYRKSDKFRR